MDTNRLAVSVDEQLSIVILILLVLIFRHWGGMIRDQAIRSVEHWSVLLFRQTEASESHLEAHHSEQGTDY